MACRPQAGNRRPIYVPQRKAAGYTDPNHSNQANETIWVSEAGLLGPFLAWAQWQNRHGAFGFFGSPVPSWGTSAPRGRGRH